MVSFSSQASRVVAPSWKVRKVRTPPGTVPDNIRGGVICRIGPQKGHRSFGSKGEMVV